MWFLIQWQGILINGQFPGPQIDSVTNDNLIITVFNSLDEPFLLSWLVLFIFFLSYIYIYMPVCVCIYIFSLWTVLSTIFRNQFSGCIAKMNQFHLAYLKNLKNFKAESFFRPPLVVCGHVEWVEVFVQMGGLDMPVNGGPYPSIVSILSEDANFWTAHCILPQFLLISIRFCLCSLAGQLLNCQDIAKWVTSHQVFGSIPTSLSSTILFKSGKHPPCNPVSPVLLWKEKEKEVRSI